MKKLILYFVALFYCFNAFSQLNLSEVACIPEGGKGGLYKMQWAIGEEFYTMNNYQDETNTIYTYSIYNSDFELIKKFEIPAIINSSINFTRYYSPLYINHIGTGGFYLSQSLFNNDEAYEYIVPFFNNGKITGLQIKNDTGEVLQEISFQNQNVEDISSLDFFTVNNKPYLSVHVYYREDNNNRNLIYVYQIDKESTSIKQVAQPIAQPINSTIIKQSENIEINLKNENVSHDIWAYKANGELLFHTIVPIGQKIIQIPAIKLSKGMNLLSIEGEQRNTMNIKVLVK